MAFGFRPATPGQLPPPPSPRTRRRWTHPSGPTLDSNRHNRRPRSHRRQSELSTLSGTTAHDPTLPSRNSSSCSCLSRSRSPNPSTSSRPTSPQTCRASTSREPSLSAAGATASATPAPLPSLATTSVRSSQVLPHERGIIPQKKLTRLDFYRTDILKLFGENGNIAGVSNAVLKWVRSTANKFLAVPSPTRAACQANRELTSMFPPSRSPTS